MPLAWLLLALSPFDVCEKDFARAEDPRSAYMCFYFTAQNEKAWEEGARRIDDVIERFPERRAWLTLVKAHIYSERDEDAAEAGYRTAADEFARNETADGEILARNNLTRILQRQRRHLEAEEQIDRVIEVAERSGDPMLMARARISEADYLTANGREVARAYRALKRAEELAFPDGSRGLKRRALSGLGQVAFATGRLDESIEAYERLLEMLRDEDDTFAAAMILFNIADGRYRKLEYIPSHEGREEVLAIATEALRSAEASENRRAEAFALQLLVELTPKVPENAEATRARAERCVAIARELGHPDKLIACMWGLAEFLAAVGDPRSEPTMAEALDLAIEAETNWYTAYAFRSRARISWRTKEYEAAVEDARAALEAVENLRQLQDEERGRAELFSDWTQDYYVLSGAMLAHGDLREALPVMERMRARALLESLAASEALTSRPVSGPDPERTKLVHEIARVQRRLLDATLTPEARASELAALERLERDEAELRSRSPLEAQRVSARDLEFVSLDELQASLTDSQAVLSYQVGLWENVQEDFGGGAWVTVVTKTDARAFRTPDRVPLEAKVPVFVGLVARRDGAESVAAETLYDELVREAVDSLPGSVDELVVIPDGVLHHLPFAALRDRRSNEALGARFALSMAPSATLWRRWRDSPPTVASVPALALADPELDLVSHEAVSPERGVFLREGVTLGALPQARREGASLVRRLGHGSRLLTAADASEHVLKQLDLTQYRILHFAAHALADDENPGRSAVVLTPGDPNEDGLLQSREISRLPLDGSIIVLSACQTASGRTLNGEGVLSLARAFFEAGAHAVVASRWPLRDDEAASFFEDFYGELGRGHSLARAMQSATENAMNDGRPSAAWSGLTVYGDGSLAPIVDGTSEARSSGIRWPLVLSLVLAIAAIAAVARLASRQREAGGS